MLGERSYRKDGKDCELSREHCSWANVYSAVKKTAPAERRIEQLLAQFMCDRHFLTLQTTVNRSKHQRLIRILNDGENVAFEEVT
jgi:hypothetical protein